MTLFFISAALLVVLCLLFLLLGLFKQSGPTVEHEAVNVTLARERRAVLDTALANGSIEQSTYDYERVQLEHDLAADLDLNTNKPSNRQGHVAAAVFVTIFVPISAGALYLHLGNPAAITSDRSTTIVSADSPQANTAQQAAGQAPALDELLPKLEERLTNSPDDIDGWRLLGRSYLSVNEFAKARQAFEKALELDNNDVPTIAQLAESIAMTNDGDLSGEATTLLERATALDASNEHTLWLLSIARQQAGDHDAAIAGFNRLAKIAGDNPDALATIEQMRSRSVREMTISASSGAGNATNPSTNDSTKVDTDEATAVNSGDDSAVSLSISVEMTEEVSSAVDANQAVFVYAKASSGPPMPLAVSRHTVSELPLNITLDDSMAMIPSMKLSSFSQVTVGARISPSGNPIAQPGDWFVEVSDVNLDEVKDLMITIDKQVP
ncbi:MAG: c-type cytochrome biogenesis protein CcmI [Granulosicoccus sp.]